MKRARRQLAVAFIAAVAMLGVAAPAGAKSHRKLPQCVVPELTGVTLKTARQRITHAHCRVGKIHRPKAASASLIVYRESPKAGRKVKRGSKIAVWLKAKKMKLKTMTPTLVAPDLTLHVSLDPSFTQNPSDPLEVTYQVSASASSGTSQAGSLPSGVLEFFSDGSLADTMNVGGGVTGGSVTVAYSTYGQHTTNVVYDSGTNSATTGNQAEMIEPLPLTMTDEWGTDDGTIPTVTTTLIGTTADVTVGDRSFEGATSVNLTDSTGAQCTAPISGITATCTMTDAATPTSYTISYPGGTTTTSSVNVADNGVQQVTDEWPADTVAVADPTVIVQQATVVECGETIAWYDVCASQPDEWPNPLAVSEGQNVQLWAAAQGDIDSDPVGAGYLDWTVAGGVEGTDFEESNLVEGSTDCAQIFQTFDLTGGGVSPGEAEGGCALRFETPGTYTVSVSYVSEDPNYGSASGPSVTIDVTS